MVRCHGLQGRPGKAGRRRPPPPRSGRRHREEGPARVLPGRCRRPSAPARRRRRGRPRSGDHHPGRVAAHRSAKAFQRGVPDGGPKRRPPAGAGRGPKWLQSKSRRSSGSVTGLRGQNAAERPERSFERMMTAPPLSDNLAVPCAAERRGRCTSNGGDRTCPSAIALLPRSAAGPGRQQDRRGDRRLHAAAGPRPGSEPGAGLARRGVDKDRESS